LLPGAVGIRSPAILHFSLFISHFSLASEGSPQCD
jgi:hypothetical protein